MVPKYIRVDPSKWARKSAYDYFSTFANPCYGFNVEMDIEEVYKLSKRRNESIFINLLYLVTTGLNSIEEMRMRILNGEVVIFDTINPAYVVMTDLGVFENCYSPYGKNYREFYDFAHKEVEDHKHIKVIKDQYNDSNYFDEFYITCIPWLKVDAMTHPLPDHDPSNSSVPRVCWSKFYEVDGRKKTMLNITVHHALVDGKPLSNAFIQIQDNFNNAEVLCK